MAEPVAVRPEVPHGEDVVWYRGWECGWSEQHDFWTGAGYIAYKGGCDLGAPEAQSGTWQGLLDAIDDEEDE